MNKPITKKEWMEYLEKTWDAAQEEALAQPEQEPVGVFQEDDDIGYVRLVPHQQAALKNGDKLYTTLPQRTWVGLSREDCYQVRERESDAFMYGVAWAEAKLKQKNT